MQKALKSMLLAMSYRIVCRLSYSGSCFPSSPVALVGVVIKRFWGYVGGDLHGAIRPMQSIGKMPVTEM